MSLVSKKSINNKISKIQDIRNIEPRLDEMEGDIPDIEKADKQSKRYVKNLICEIEEIDSWMEILNEETTYARYKVLYRDKRSTKEAWWHRFRHALLKIQLNSWQVKRDELFEKLIAKLEELKQTENVNGSTDGQEPTPINSEPTIKIENEGLGFRV